MEKNFRARNWCWELFYTDGSKYRRNNTHRNAWCRGCLKARSAFLKAEDEERPLPGQTGLLRSEEELDQQAINDIDPICGKIPTLHTHLAGCRYVDSKDRRRASLDRARPSHRVRAAEPSSAVQPSFRPVVEAGGQEWFETALCRTAVSAGWSWKSLNDPEFVYMMSVLRPDLTVPDRRLISGRILDDEVGRVVRGLQNVVEGRFSTGMCDGWKNVAKTAVIAAMITVNHKAHITHIHEVSASRKTAENLLAIVQEEINYVEQSLGSRLVAWCSDASGESRAMRRRLHALRPSLITLDCYSHQVNLIVGDYFKRVDGAAQCADNANKVIKWFRNHSFALGKLRQCQESVYNGKVLALITPVLTRWTAHYCSMARLEAISKALIICVWKHESELLDSSGPASSDSRKLALEVFSIAKDLRFWEGVHQIKLALEPLAVAANITQAADTRMDHIAVTMGSLYDFYCRDSMPDQARQAILESLEKRWAKSDQDAFIAAVYLNPFYRHHLFNKNEAALLPLGLYALLKRLFARIFPDETLNVADFYESNDAYAAGRGVFSDERMYLQEIKELSERDGARLTLLDVWGNLAAGTKSGPQQFAQLAQCILSIVPNSAGCERLFSQMGTVHTDMRNRLTTSSARKIVQLKMDLRARHEREGLIQPRPQRQYGPDLQPVLIEQEPTPHANEREDEDEEENVEADVNTCDVVGALIEDADADEDYEDESGELDQGDDTDRNMEVEQHICNNHSAPE